MNHPMLRALLFCLAILPATAFSQMELRDWKFKTGDDPSFHQPNHDISYWSTITPGNVFENQGFANYDGYCWYAIRFTLPSSLKDLAGLKDSVRFLLGPIDDCDETYLNGKLLGKTGSFPDSPKGYITGWNEPRRYVVPAKSPMLHWDAINEIDIRVYDGGGKGGMWEGTPTVGMVDYIDFVQMNAHVGDFVFAGKKNKNALLIGDRTVLEVEGGGKQSLSKEIQLMNRYVYDIEGTLSMTLQPKKGNPVNQSLAVKLSPFQSYSHEFVFPNYEHAKVLITFKEKRTGKTIESELQTPYILTPAEKNTPKITNAAIYGARPGRPFQWAVRSTGKQPITFSATGLPSTITLDPKTGLLSGFPTEKGEYDVTFTAKNAAGKFSKKIRISIGDKISLTPPMGWNSWNCWGLSVSDEKVRKSVDAMVKSGLANHGWNYINIDDGWEKGRDPQTGEMIVNEKFPSLKALSDYIHEQGLKIGIYSSPGPKTCGGYEGSYQHERQDVKAWDRWGIDYIKYDWCSYSDVVGGSSTDWKLSTLQHPYLLLDSALREANRDIVFSLCQYGMGNVWEWGKDVGGNLWRTTGDIEDTWESMSGIGFQQDPAAQYSKPGGGWNDPDMLTVGWVGWGDHLHQTRLNASEQYTHISLWALLSAPLLIGCDLSRIDPFTYNLLANDEVLAIDQDPLGKGARRLVQDGDVQIWVKDIADGRKAVGVFNLDKDDHTLFVDFAKMGLQGSVKMRDAWRQKDLGKWSVAKKYPVEVYGHGVVLLVVE